MMEVSVIIPCHNAEPYIAQAIGSVLEQSRSPLEVIVVDDGSTDRSASIARSFGGRVKVVSARCGRASKARNYGYRFATGDALMFLDADDVLGPTVLESLVDVLSANPEGIATCPWYRLEKVEGKWVQRPRSCSPRREDQDHLGNWLTGWWHPPCSVLWSRPAYERAGGWDERATVNDDGDIIMRALIEGVLLASAPHGAAYYRRLPGDQTSLSGTRFTEAGLSSRIYVAEKIAAWLEERGRMNRYREPLRKKFEEVGRDCKGSYPHLHERCESLARRYGGSPWARMARPKTESLLGRVGAVPERLRKKLGRIKRSLVTRPEPASSKRDRESLEEIRFGLDAAARVGLQRAPEVERADGAGEDVALNPPEVSVIIPTYNRARLIGRAIESVLAQTFEDFEILVVDDGSTDATAEVVEGYRDARTRYLAQPENRGVSAARNRGLREARGTYIAFLDSDDEWFPDKLEKQVAYFRQLPDDVGLIYCGVETVGDEGESWTFRPTQRAERGDAYRDLLRENVIHTGSGVMVRRNVVRTAGFFDEEIPAIEDWDYWLRIARFYKLDFVEEPLIKYYDVEGFERKSLSAHENLAARAWFFRKHAAEMRRAGVDHLFLIESARRHLVQLDDAKAVRRLMLEALLRQPLEHEVYHPPFSRLALAPQVRKVLREGS